MNSEHVSRNLSEAGRVENVVSVSCAGNARSQISTQVFRTIQNIGDVMILL